MATVGYDVRSERLKGTTTIKAKATQELSRFNLDLALPASAVSVNGAEATFTQTTRELVVTPDQAVADGRQFTVEVTYAGKPGAVEGEGIGGWFETDDGAFAAGEPEVAVLWYPSNDHPTDKATFDITIRAARGKQAVSNGQLIKRTPEGSDVRWHWRVTEPMTTYLATMVVGDYKVKSGTTPGGLPYTYAISDGLSGEVRRNAVRSLKMTPDVVDFYSKQFGEYPFASTGGILLNEQIGFALENQTKPIYSRVFFESSRDTEVIAHELAHQWWGDSVSLRRWQYIWLNEGFATWSAWLYEAEPKFTLNDFFTTTYDRYRNDEGFWRTKISDPGADKVFDGAVYDRGAMALQALRNKIGKRDHQRLLRQWYAAHRDGDATLQQFTKLAEKVSGKQLDRFFREWLEDTDRPRPSKQLGFPQKGRAGAVGLPDTDLDGEHREAFRAHSLMGGQKP
jgi:aminopeptidase N